MTRPQIRLLTYRSLPSSTDPQHSDLWPDRYAGLSDRLTYFENHYIQSPLDGDLLQVLGTAGTWQSIADYVRQHEIQVASVCLAIDGEEETPLRLPEWLNCNYVSLPSGEQVGIPEAVAAAFAESAWSWLHVDIPADRLTPDLFAQCVQVVDGSAGGEASDVFLVTSLQGARQQCPDPFESILFEGRIRVPLWASFDGRRGGTESDSQRILSISGSHDVAATILAVLNEREEQSTEPLGEDHAARSLAELVQQSAHQPDRQLKIKMHDANAIRSGRFLFVQQASESVDSDREHALYSKPEDVWNVHDVSGQYPDVVDELTEALKV